MNKSLILTTPGILMSVILAVLSLHISNLMPAHAMGAGVISLLLGMLFNPLMTRYPIFLKGLTFTSKKVLKFAIIMMGTSLSFIQVLEVGKYSLVVMTFTLFAAFGGGYILGKAFDMDWRLSSLISAGTGICGASAVAAIAPVIDSEDSQIAYAISATFIFDVVMVVLFPLMGVYFGMNDLGFGLWTGTAVNDTSSVVAAGYAFSDAAGNFAVIVKLTRTLAIVPVVLIFSWINSRSKSIGDSLVSTKKVDISAIFPWFIPLFLLMVGIKSAGLIPASISLTLSDTSKFLMVMALGSIGLKTNFSKLAKSGLLPMAHGFLISTLVVIVSFAVQSFLGQI
ncbi:YeiH family protein [Gudongella sp. DL1XJH-153]|uniref:YeiH family protein n=1 Tax=Gudongella sp. DL1XJH-153 TaxID=3409804 RepID=UPI003BB5A8C5